MVDVAAIFDEVFGADERAKGPSENGCVRCVVAHYTTLAVWKVLLRFGNIRLQTSAALSGWCRIHFLS